MDPVICWDSFQSKNIDHVANVISAGFKRIRIFFNIQYIPSNSLTVTSTVTDWQNFINHLFNTLPRGYNNWDNNSKDFWAGPEINGKDSEIMKDVFDMMKRECQKGNLLEPIVCIGASEEVVPNSWLGRCPSLTMYPWLGRFAKEFARYLKTVYKFVRADLECWNEPNECQELGMGVDKYCDLSVYMCTGWKSISPNYKTHVFSCNIIEQPFLDYILSREDLLKVTDYISTHILTDTEWDSNYIDGVNWKLANYPIAKKYGLKHSLLEMSPISHDSRISNLFRDRINSLRGRVSMYGFIFYFKNEIVHTGDLDEVLTYDLNTGAFLGIAGDKKDFVTQFNREVYNMYEDEKNYNIPTEISNFANAIGLAKKTNYSPYLPILTAYFFGNTNYFHKPEQLLSKRDFDAFLEGMLNLIAKVSGISDRLNVWYDENGNYRTDAQRNAVTKSNPK